MHLLFPMQCASSTKRYRAASPLARDKKTPCHMLRRQVACIQPVWTLLTSAYSSPAGHCLHCVRPGLSVHLSRGSCLRAATEPPKTFVAVGSPIWQKSETVLIQHQTRISSAVVPQWRAPCDSRAARWRSAAQRRSWSQPCLTTHGRCAVVRSPDASLISVKRFPVVAPQDEAPNAPPPAHATCCTSSYSHSMPATHTS